MTPKTFRKIFSQQELKQLLGERVLVLHKQEPNRRGYEITIMPVPGADGKPESYQMRVEVTEKES